MAHRLTPQQKKLVKAKIKNPDATSEQLALQTGYDSGPSVRRALVSPNIRARISDLMEKHDKLKREIRLEKLAEGLDATYPTKLGEHADYATRHKYLDTAFKLAGDLNQENDVTPQAQILIINAIKESRQEGLSK